MYIRHLVSFFILLISSEIFNLDAKEKQTICLNMIVKDESEVICDCLKSVKPFIDYWVIVDTGSTDGTQTVIKYYMRDIPGELHERPWKDFGHNRTEALKLAKGKADYILIMDADDYLEYENGFKMPFLDKDGYYLRFNDSGLEYTRRQLIKDSIDWSWKGVLHEYLHANRHLKESTLDDIKYVRTGGGARSRDPRKYEKDAEVLEKAMIDEPNNERYQFYLAQSYKTANNYEKAIENYKKRVDMKGWDQEVFYSLLQIAEMQDSLGYPEDVIIESLFKAQIYRPSRAEPFYYLANYFRKKEKYFTGYYMAEQGLKIPPSNDNLFVEKWIYDYGLLFECSICAYWVGDYKKAKEASTALMANPKVPEYYREFVEKNLVFIDSKLAER